MDAASQLSGHYELRNLQGRAGVVEVWDAFDTHSQLNVTLKIFRPDVANDPDFFQRFEQEAEQIASLRHPNIVQIRDFQVVKESKAIQTVAYLVTDPIKDTQPLVDYMHTTSAAGQFPAWETVVQLFSPLCAAVDYAHSQGVVHRNINPTNILLTSHDNTQNHVGEPLLTDFGIAAILGTTSSPRPGMLQGDPRYQAPEQLQGYRGNELSDIYALGVILYQLCTGVLPFSDTGSNAKAVAGQRTDATPQPPGLSNPAIPPALTLVLLKGLTKDPAGRFPSATALANAVAEALNIFTPGNSSVATIKTMNLPTYLTIERAEEQTNVADLPTLAIAKSPVSLSDITDMPTLATAKSADSLSPPPKPRRKRRSVLIALIALVILLAGSIALAAFYGFPRSGTKGTSVAGAAIAGHAFFLSSGHVNPNTNQGINDGLQVTLQHVSAPAPGMNYYAWLLNDRQNTGVGAVTPILLGALSVTDGAATLTYKDKKYTNLLAIFNRLVITEEDASVASVGFPADTSTWKYVAVLPRTTLAKTKISLLDHLRYLLSDEPTLDTLGLHGGLTIWFTKYIEAITIWAGSARDYWTGGGPNAIRSQLIRMLDVLDSAKYVQKDVPAGSSLEITVPVALLTLNGKSQVPQSFLYQIGSNLKAITMARGATSAQIQLARKITASLARVSGWLAQVHKDAVQLLQMSNAQLQSQASLSMLNDMAAQALYAYVGQLDPASNQVIPGATQIYDNVEHLVTFTITAYGGRRG